MSRLREDLKVSRLLAPRHCISLNAQVFPAYMRQPNSLNCTVSEVKDIMERSQNQHIARHSPKMEELYILLYVHIKEKQTQKMQGFNFYLILVTNFLFILVCVCIKKEWKFLHSKLQPVLTLQRFLFVNFVSGSHKQISFPVKSIETENKERNKP